jgi:hypothetical protein
MPWEPFLCPFSQAFSHAKVFFSARLAWNVFPRRLGLWFGFGLHAHDPFFYDYDPNWPNCMMFLGKLSKFFEIPQISPF